MNGLVHLFRESRAVMDSIADLRYHEKKHHKTYASKQMEGLNGTITGNDVLYPRYRDFLHIPARMAMEIPISSWAVY